MSAPRVIDTLLDVEGTDPAAFRAEVCALCRDLLPTWTACDVEVVDVRLDVIAGGITNDLRLVTPLGPSRRDDGGDVAAAAAAAEEEEDRATVRSLPPVVLRVFGDGTERFLNRARESAALLELNGMGFGAQCFGIFGNGRLEKALLDTRPLTPAEMALPAVAREIARETRRFHEVRVSARWDDDDGDETTAAAGMGKQSETEATASDTVKTAGGGGGGGGSGGYGQTVRYGGGGGGGGEVPRAQTWDVLRREAREVVVRVWGLWVRRWHGMATTWGFEAAQGEEAAAAAAADKRRRRDALRLGPLARDIDALEAACAAAKSPTVLLHNDLLSGNFLVPARWRASGDDEIGGPEDDDVDDVDEDDDDGWVVLKRGASAEDSGGGGGGSCGGYGQTVRDSGGGGECGEGGGGTERDDVWDTPRRRGRRVPLTVIDFEYSCYGPRGFDLANHFVEYAGFECDWSKLPGREARRWFFASYLRAGHGHGGGEDGRRQTVRGDGDESLEEAMDALEREAAAYTPVSHLWWGLWAVMQATISTIDFDYLGYASLRLGEYRKLRAAAAPGALDEGSKK